MTDHYTDRVTESLDRVATESQAGRCQFSSKSRTDGRTDGLTKNYSPSDESSTNASPAGGQSEFTQSEDEKRARQLLIAVGAAFGERATVIRRGVREPINATTRRLIYRRDGWTCQRCHAFPFAADERRRSGALHLDHIIPWSAGGPDKTWNLRTLCGPCNEERSNRVTGEEKFSTPIVRICLPCHPSIEPPAMKPATAFDVYCACRHHAGWAIPGWSIL